MTLAVARFFDNKKDLIIKSDTRLTFEEKQSLHKSTALRPLNGNLKTVILTPRLCLSYAGNVSFANELIKDFYLSLYQKCNSYEVFLEEILNVHKKSNSETDFLMAFAGPEQSRIDKISNGKIESGLTTGWIGDYNAFKDYQKYYHTEDETLTTDRKMFNAFDRLLSDTKSETVGDYHITAYLDFEMLNNNAPIFLYDYHSNLKPHDQRIEANTQTAIYPGTPDVGGYGVCYLRTLSRSSHGVALYFPEGRYGLFFCPTLFLDKDVPTTGKIFKNLGGKEFAEHIQKKYTVPLQGIIVDEGRICPLNLRKVTSR